MSRMLVMRADTSRILDIVMEKVTVSRAVGRALRTARQTRFPEDSQSDFARRIGVSRATYAKMEAGDLSPSFRAFWAAFELFGCDERIVAAIVSTQRSLLDDL